MIKFLDRVSPWGIVIGAKLTEEEKQILGLK